MQERNLRAQGTSLPKLTKIKVQQQFLPFLKVEKQIVPCQSTGKEVLFEWSYHEISSTHSLVRTTL